MTMLRFLCVCRPHTSATNAVRLSSVCAMSFSEEIAFKNHAFFYAAFSGRKRQDKISKLFRVLIIPLVSDGLEAI